MQAEYFKADVRGIASALVRESLQNSLDARQSDEEPVRVRITVVQHNAVHAKDLSKDFKGLPAHITACGIDQPAPSQLISERSLVVEDFNTCGLLGDPKETAPSDGNHFFYFVRAEGKSGKAGGKGGRWGLGKHVYAMASNINTYWAYTNAADKQDDLLIGISILKHHDIGDKGYEPDGWWADSPDDLPLPLSDADLLADFRTRWRMERRRGQQGLSVVVPHIGAVPEVGEDEWSQANLQSMILEHFGVAILAGQLTVEIARTGSTPVEVSRLDAAGVLELAQPEHSGIEPELRARLRMIADGLTSAHVDVPDAASDWSTLKWDNLSEADRASMESAAERLESGEVLRFKVPVGIQRRGEPKASSSFDVVVRKRDSAGSGRPSYHRSGMWILDEKGMSPLGSFDAAVIALEDGISDLLGDAENPAHTRWRLSSGEFTKRWVAGRGPLTFVRHAPHRLISLIFKTEEVGDFTVAEEFFGISEAQAGALHPGGGRTRNTTKVVRKPQNLPPAKPTRISVRNSEHGAGFRIAAPKLPSGTELAIRVGYAISRGDGIRRWSESDFEIGKSPITHVCAGGSIKTAERNTLVVTIDRPSDFFLDCHGFDPLRDLAVDARLMGDAASETGEVNA